MRWVAVGMLALALGAFETTAGADEYPNRPIHVVIGFAAGSGAFSIRLR
jgi:tripartite-type tricarboxylate transporter receptor subunit TctC